MPEPRSRRRLPAIAPPADERFVPEAGREPVPGYRLLRLRGRGAFATVWESTSPDGERVALKFMSSQNSTSTARELRSVRAISRVTHPNLLRTRDVWSLSGQIVICMDLADASMLDLFLLYAEEFRQPIPAEKLLLNMHQVGEALDHLNARQHPLDGKLVGLQHGDIKPNNILLVGDSAFLADYGLASPTFGPSTPCSRQGTMEYAAPEIFAGALSDASDQFALGVTYALLRTGAFPFPAPPKQPGKSYVRPPADLSGVPEDERPVVARALAPVPQSRYPSCGEFVKALLRVNRLEPAADPVRGTVLRPTGQPASRVQMVGTIRA